MKEIIDIYKHNRDIVENFIFTTVARLEFDKEDSVVASKIFKNIGCARLVYFVNDNYLVRSPYFFKQGENDTKLGDSKKYYFEKSQVTQGKPFLSNPYISSNTGKANITFAKKLDNGYVVIDFDVIAILESLKLVESSKIARTINSFVYGFMGFSLLFFAVFLGVYAIVIFADSVIQAQSFNLESTFKAIIALTLGLAIFDLARTILEYEIFFKSLSKDRNKNELLSKFLISIIIALSIEALMVVFKIAIKDYTDMIHAMFLIVGVSFMIYTLGKYNRFTKTGD
jgi:hypothetical protein